MYVQVVNATMKHVDQIMLGLGIYLFHVSMFSKQNHVVRHIMINPRELKSRSWTDCMAELNKYLSFLPGVNASEKLVRGN